MGGTKVGGDIMAEIHKIGKLGDEVNFNSENGVYHSYKVDT